MEVAIGNVLFPDVLHAVQQLRLTSPSRETRTFARRVANEKIIFDQFLRRLALVSPQAVDQDEHARDIQVLNVQSRIGPQAVHEIQRDLTSMTEVLHALKADLSNASRGTAVLAKLGRRTSPLKAPAESSPLQKSLGEVSKTNKRLSAYLLPDFLPLPVSKQWKAPLDVHIQIPEQRSPNTALFRISGNQFTCSCTSIPGNNTPLQITTFASGPQDEAGGLVHQSELLQIKISSTSLSLDSTPSAAAANLQRQSSVSDVGILNRPLAYSEKPSASNTRIQISCSQAESTRELVSLLKFIESSGRSLEPAERAQMAFNVALAMILTLIGVPPFNSFDPKAGGIYVDVAEPDDPFALFLTPEHNPEYMPSNQGHANATAISIMTRNLALGRLGLAIIQIMFGRTLAEIEANGDSSVLGEDQYVRDFITAKTLLQSSRIRQKLGEEFENIISSCLNQQYREDKSSKVVSLSESDTSFPRQAASLILLPLFQEVRRANGCFCGAQESPVSMLRDYLDLRGNRPSVDHDNRSSGDRGNSSWQDINTTFNQRSDESVSKDRTPTVSQKLDQPFSSSEQSERAALLSSLPRQSPSQDTSSEAERLKNPEIKTTEQRKEPPESENVQRPINSQPLVELLGTAASGRMFGLHSDHVPESEGSFETTSENTESWPEWMSDETDDTPNFAEDHPLNSLNPISIAILTKQYAVWRNCSPGEGQGSGTAGPSIQANAARTGPNRKRPRPDDKDPNEDDGANGDDGAGPSKVQKGSAGKDDGPSFSCPYFKKDSTKYGVCSKYELNRIRDVKQHLTRKHQMPLYCPRCYRIFRDELSRDEHTRNVDCPRRQEGRPEGITEGQRKALARKASSNQSAKEQWYGIYELLFPAFPRPASPYIDSAFQKSAFVLQSFLLTEGPRIMGSVIQASGALTSPFSPQDLDAWTEHVLLLGFQEILSRFSTAATAPTAPRIEPTALSNPGADITSPMNLNYQSPTDPANHSMVSTEGDFIQGGNLFRNSIADSETASSVSGMFSWDTTDSEALYNTGAGGSGDGVGVVQNGYTVAQFNGNLHFTTQEGLVLQQTLNQGMSRMNFDHGSGRHHSRNNSSRNNFITQNDHNQPNSSNFGR